MAFELWITFIIVHLRKLINQMFNNTFNLVFIYSILMSLYRCVDFCHEIKPHRRFVKITHIYTWRFDTKLHKYIVVNMNCPKILSFVQLKRPIAKL